MTIFQHYTGNAMLDNALMTMEALAGLKHVSEISSDVLLKIYKEPIKGFSLIDLNQRLKSYTMIFSLNNPLVNPAKKTDNVGVKVYNGLLQAIMANVETSGTKICEISGLKYEKSFEGFYREEIDKLIHQVKLKNLEGNKEKSEISNLANTDVSINRCWFPLVGGLGSDAQALPQAKFSLQIHPICLAVMQFLPTSALLFKGGVLLVDSSNSEFSRSFVSENVKEIQKRVALVKAGEAIENVKDFSKGSYLLTAIRILNEKQIDDEYSDLNLWSFSNSGTGASCEIDRIPNELIQKVIKLQNSPGCKTELLRILQDKSMSTVFLNNLEDNQEWWGLYPAKKYDGVSVEFFEAYLKIIGSNKKIEYAKYIAQLISKFKTKSFEKYLIKTDAFTEKEYRSDLFAVLIKASQEGEWSLAHQLQIVDNKDAFPVKNTFYNILKTIHFFYQKRLFVNSIENLTDLGGSEVAQVCKWVISLIQNDEKSQNFIKRLTDIQEYSSVNYYELFIRASDKETTSIESIFYALNDENGKPNRIGVNELMRLFFSQKEQPKEEINYLENAFLQVADDYKVWFCTFSDFANDYQFYYYDKYENKETGQKPYNKYLKQVLSIPFQSYQFSKWFDEATENTNSFLEKTDPTVSQKWSDTLFYNPQGEGNIGFARFLLQFSMLKTYYQSLSLQIAI